jgi:trinucleotide repeat-containing gene 6 protein
MLKNLTSQIDGSILRTLCVQHGQFQDFQLFPSHGIALCKYNTFEEANKAQQALNNCVLSNVTICAESPSDSEVQNIMKHLGVQQQIGNLDSNVQSWQPPSAQGSSRVGPPDSIWGAF